jgi:hypothetical protein
MITTAVLSALLLPVAHAAAPTLFCNDAGASNYDDGARPLQWLARQRGEGEGICLREGAAARDAARGPLALWPRVLEPSRFSLRRTKAAATAPSP